MATVDVLVQGNQDVYAAGRVVLAAIRRGEETNAAASALLSAAEASSVSATGVITQGLVAYESEGATSGAVADLVATALSELSQSNVLLAAGAVLADETPPGAGDGETTPTAADLESALVELDRATEALIDEATRQGGRLGFGAVEPEIAAINRASLDGFRAIVATTLDDIVEAAARLTTAILRRAGDLPADQVARAAGTIGDQLGEPIGGLRRLVTIGLEKLRSAVNALMKLLGEERAREVRGWIAEQWKTLTSGTLLAGPLRVLLGAGPTCAMADALGADGSPAPETVEDASIRVSSVGAEFGRTAARVEHHVGVLASAAGWGFLASKLLPALAPWVTAAAVSGYVALLGIGLLQAMDVADAGLDLGRVVGVRGIVASL